MLTWIIILFIAAALQLFRTNQAIYSSVVGAHLQMFEGAWKANCFQKQQQVHLQLGRARPGDLATRGHA